LSIMLRFISLLSIPLTLLMFYGMIRSVGKEQVYRKQLYIKGIVMTCFMMLVNFLFMIQAVFSWCAVTWPLFILAGLGFGYQWGKTSNKMYQKGDALFVKRSVLHLVFWAASYAFTHLLTTVFPSNFATAGLATMFFSTGSSIGVNANLALRQNKNAALIPPASHSAPKGIGSNSCPRCGNPVQPEHTFCINCGFHLR
jgi:membrane protein CcdC involved in cytochrome C biogenesis